MYVSVNIFNYIKTVFSFDGSEESTVDFWWSHQEGGRPVGLCWLLDEYFSSKLLIGYHTCLVT